MAPGHRYHAIGNAAPAGAVGAVMATEMRQERSIVLRTSGARHGPITRLVSPHDIGPMIKPFVFLDYVDAPGGQGPKFGFHPHSGIATLTYPLTFDIEHELSTGQVDHLARGGLEWVVAGSGVWHRAQALNGDSLRGFQIWFALPPSHEAAPASTQFVASDDVPQSGPVTVLLGTFDGASSSISTPLDVNYLWVQLKAGEVWSYCPPTKHQVAWVFSQSGTLEVLGEKLVRELAVFSEGNGHLRFRAHDNCAFLLGTAAKHAHALVLGNYSVHTTEAALTAGQQRIVEIGEELKRKGQLA